MLLEKLINTAYSFGAAVVVFGAWAKIEHKASGDDALTIGLLVESGIFCLYGLMEWRKTTAAPQLPEPKAGETPATGELTDTVKQTNQILKRIFKAD